jgi:hypothetical protein
MVDREDSDALLIGALYGELTPAEEARLQAHLADLFSVAAEVHFRETTAFQILKRKARHPPPRPLAQVLNGRILGMEG